jgi:hypothetical protein
MPLEIVGAGFGRTGTFTLKTILEQIGFDKCYHMADVFEDQTVVPTWLAATRKEPVDWDKLFDGYKAAVDWPASAFWRELADYYPDAKVLLSLRDPEKWYKSFSSTIKNVLEAPLPEDNELMAAHMRMTQELIAQNTFDNRLDDKGHLIDVFNRHNEEVKRAIDPARLLVYEVSEGWDPLCAFLGVPVPAEPFPHTNTTEDFKKGFENVDEGVDLSHLS